MDVRTIGEGLVGIRVYPHMSDRSMHKRPWVQHSNLSIETSQAVGSRRQRLGTEHAC